MSNWGKRMRRGKEMYPSFDTRRVLCKQHRPYCVKPLRGFPKQNNASNAASIMSEANDPKKRGTNKSIVRGRVHTKMSAAGQSTSAWNAMSQLAFASASRPGLSIRQQALFLIGGSTTVLKLSQNLPTKPHLKNGQNWHGLNGLS